MGFGLRRVWEPPAAFGSPPPGLRMSLRACSVARAALSLARIRRIDFRGRQGRAEYGPGGGREDARGDHGAHPLCRVHA
eukprot:3808715-Prymnesium_polylepis.1